MSLFPCRSKHICLAVKYENDICQQTLIKKKKTLVIRILIVFNLNADSDLRKKNNERQKNDSV